MKNFLKKIPLFLLILNTKLHSLVLSDFVDLSNRMTDRAREHAPEIFIASLVAGTVTLAGIYTYAAFQAQQRQIISQQEALRDQEDARRKQEQEHKQKIQGLESKFTEFVERMGAQFQQAAQHRDQQHGEVMQRHASLKKKIGVVDEKVDEVTGQVVRVGEQVGEVKGQVDAAHEKLDGIGGQVNDVHRFIQQFSPNGGAVQPTLPAQQRTQSRLLGGGQQSNIRRSVYDHSTLSRALGQHS